MNYIDYSKLGGMPVTQFTLDFNQSAFSNAIKAVGKMIGDKVIMYGVEEVSGSVTDGWVVIAGELLPFKSGVMLANVDIVETVGNRTYNDTILKPVYFTREVQFVSTGGFPFSELKRPAGVIGDYLVPKGMISMWSGSIASIPRGWALCDGAGTTPDLSGKFIVGYDATDTDYDTIGNTGGSKDHTIDQTQLPASMTFSMPLVPHTTGGAPKGVTDGGTSAGNTNITIVNPGGGQSFDQRPNYYTLAYIIKL